MNKQEKEQFISFINNAKENLNFSFRTYHKTYPGYIQGNKLINYIEQLDEPQITDEQAWNKIAEAYPETAQSLRITLDHAVFGRVEEPQKVKVPAFVVEYFNYCIANERTLAEALSGLDRDFKIPDYLYPAIKWLEDSINQNIFAQAWLYGFEVEEEPKWVVKVDDNAYFVDFFDSLTPHLVDGLGWEVMRLDDKSKADAVALIIGGKAEKV